MDVKSLERVTVAWLIMTAVAFVGLLWNVIHCMSLDESMRANLAELRSAQSEIAEAGPLPRVMPFKNQLITDRLSGHFVSSNGKQKSTPVVTIKVLTPLIDSELILVEAVVFLPQTTLAGLNQRLTTLPSEFCVEAIGLKAVSQKEQDSVESWAADVTLTTIRVAE